MSAAVLYEASGRVRDALIARGISAVSVDLRETEAPGPHVVADVLAFLRENGSSLRLIIAHPPCTYLASSGLHWNGRVYGRAACTAFALDHVRRLFAALDESGARYAVENPAGMIGTNVRPADQTIQPFNFGDDASKRTCFWLKGLPPLRPTARVEGRLVDDGRPQLGLFGTGVERFANQTDGGQNKLTPSPDRWALRSETFPGVAAAIADQWGRFAL